MTVNFDNLRVQAANDYSRLCTALNEFIKQAEKEGYEEHHVPIDPAMIQEYMDDLRSKLTVICCSYDETAGIKSVGDDIDFPLFNRNI